MISSVARKGVVVADSPELHRDALARICSLDQIDVLVTEQPVTGTWSAALEAAEVEVIVARVVDPGPSRPVGMEM